MKYKVYTVNVEGKIEFTKEELEKLLEEIYQEGYEKGKVDYIPLHWGENIKTIPTSPPTGTGVKPWWENPTVITTTYKNDDINRPTTGGI